MPPAFYRKAAWLMTFTERFGLSFLYLWYAYGYGSDVQAEWLVRADWQAAEFACFARDVSMLVLMLFEGLFLLLSRQPKTTPANLKEIMVPLATSFFYFAYNGIEQLPHWAQASLLPEKWLYPVSTAGLGMDALGTMISIWGVCYLGRSFGIYVAVREIVLRGPYRLVRHPIYCGYLFMFAGIALTFFSPAAFVIVAIHYALFYYRARLEEKRLAESSPEYRDYQKRTGFLLPRIWRKKT